MGSLAFAHTAAKGVANHSKLSYQWVIRDGVSRMHKTNRQKAKLLYMLQLIVLFCFVYRHDLCVMLDPLLSVIRSLIRDLLQGGCAHCVFVLLTVHATSSAFASAFPAGHDRSARLGVSVGQRPPEEQLGAQQPRAALAIHCK